MKQHNITYHNVPRETFDSVSLIIENKKEKLESYLALLIWWNKRINLVSRSVPRETLWAHICHSILLTEIPGFQREKRVVDAGTGGGLPGIPLAITNPQKEFILNDIVGKKVTAVKQMIKKLSLSNASALNNSIANIEITQPYCLVSKHAFKINDLYKMVHGHNWKHLVFYKGDGFEDELDGINPSIKIDAYRLFENSNQNFYKGKVVVILEG